MNGYVKFRPATLEAIPSVEAVAKEQDHTVIAATDILEKDGKVVGYLSVGGMPMILGWVSTQDVPKRETFHIVNTTECVAARLGWNLICVPMPKHSPFHQVMEELGYHNGGSYDLFTKTLCPR